MKKVGDAGRLQDLQLPGEDQVGYVPTSFRPAMLYSQTDPIMFEFNGP